MVSRLTGKLNEVYWFGKVKGGCDIELIKPENLTMVDPINYFQVSFMYALH